MTKKEIKDALMDKYHEIYLPYLSIVLKDIKLKNEEIKIVVEDTGLVVLQYEDTFRKITLFDSMESGFKQEKSHRYATSYGEHLKLKEIKREVIVYSIFWR